MHDERVAAIVLDSLPESGVAHLLDDNQPLAELGADSMVVVRMIYMLEGEFDIVFDDTALLPENFATLGKVRSVVRELIAGGRG